MPPDVNVYISRAQLCKGALETPRFKSASQDTFPEELRPVTYGGAIANQPLSLSEQGQTGGVHVQSLY